MLSKPLIITNIASVILCFGLYYLWDGEKEQRIFAEQSLELTKVTLDNYKKDFKQQSEELNALNRSFGRLDSEYKIAVNQLNNYRDREYVAKKKPELVSRAANRATKRLFNEICAATGGDCKVATSKGSASTAN